MTIRLATAEDVALLTRLIRDAFHTAAHELGLTPENWPPPPPQKPPHHLRGQLHRGVVFHVLDHGGVPCGCVGIEQSEPEVYRVKRLAVPPPHRGQGFATALVRHAEAQARRRGARRLELGIYDGQPRLRAWYERRGFRHRETRSLPHLPVAVAFMYKDL